MEKLKALYEAVLSGDAAASRSITEQALSAGTDPVRLVNDYMVPAMDEVGRRFEACEYFVPELLISARAMKASLELIRPLLAARGAQPLARVAIGTVKGDLHDIGKNLVAAMLEGGGLKSLTWESTSPRNNSLPPSTRRTPTSLPCPPSSPPPCPP